MKLAKRTLISSAILATLMTTNSVFAAQTSTIDVSDALAGIASAGVALLAVIGALMALSVTIFGISKVYRFLSRKAGA